MQQGARKLLQVGPGLGQLAEVLCCACADCMRRCRGAKNKEELNRVLTSHIMLRRLKKDVLSQIPALQRSRISVLPDPRNLKVA